MTTTVDDSCYLAGGPLWWENPGVDERLACLVSFSVGQSAVISFELRYAACSAARASHTENGDAAASATVRIASST